MQSINQLTASLSSNLTTLTNSEQKQQLSTVEQIASQEQFQTSLDLIIDLFEQWAGLYGKKLQGRQNLSLQTAETWAVALKLMNVSKREFDIAHAKSLCMEWPPTAAYDFLALGRTETASEYPEVQAAFTTACQNCGMRGDVKRNWKHEVIYETANRIGWGVLASATDHYFKSFQGVYDEVVNEHKNGTRFDIPQERQLAYERTVLQENSPMAATVDDFLNQFKRKHGEAV